MINTALLKSRNNNAVFFIYKTTVQTCCIIIPFIKSIYRVFDLPSMVSLQQCITLHERLPDIQWHVTQSELKISWTAAARSRIYCIIWYIRNNVISWRVNSDIGSPQTYIAVHFNCVLVLRLLINENWRNTKMSEAWCKNETLIVFVKIQ